MLERYARNMAEHRQNVVMTPWNLIRVTRESSGDLDFDFGRFDRYVELFERAGAAERIEIGHVGHGRERLGHAGRTRSGPRHDRGPGKTVALGPEEGLAPLAPRARKPPRRARLAGEAR